MKFILYGVGSFSTLCTVVIFIYLLDTGPAETGSSVSSDAASEPLMPYIALLFGIIFILVFGGVILHLLSARKQSLRLIQTELDEGKRMYKEAGRTDAGRSRAQRGQFKKVSPAQKKSAVAYTVGQRLYKEEGEHAGGSGPVQVLLADMGQEAGAARFGSVAEEMTGGGAPVDRDSRRSSGLRPGRGAGAGYGLADLTQDLRPLATLLLPVLQGPLPRLPCRTD
jgi:hypothetical protein